MQRQATKSKLKREKIKIESEMASTTTDDVLSTIAAAKTITCGNICVLCRQEMLLDSCCCRQAVEADNMSGSSVETNRSSSINKISSETSASGNDIVIINIAARNSCFILKKNSLRLATIPTGFERWCTTKVESTGKKRGLKCSGNRSSEENDEGSLKNNRRQREKFNIFSNCHNILRTLQSLLLLMFNCGIFNKRRRRQQQQQKNVIYTKFLLLLQTLSAATTRLSLSPNNYNQQQQLKHNQQLSSATPHHQQPDKQKRFLHLRHYHPWNSSLIWILAVNLLIIHGTGSVALQQQPQHLPQNNITDKLNALSVSTHSRPPRSQPNEAMQLAQNVTPCKSIDIRNLASQFSQLENCTVIEGFLLINLINDASPLNKSFPRLTEVTEFVVVYRVSGLHSLSKVFPNLSVIRGLYLFDAYALVVYTNLDLTDLGLSKLRSITRGGVRIEKNQKLCFADTIDWKHIMGEGNLTESQVVILGNAKPEDCKDTKCPGKVRIGEDQYSTALSGELSASCRALSPNQTRYCWDSKICQTICPTNCRDNCFDEHTCCHKDCLGGCIRDKNGNQRCIGCRNVSFNNICVESCPKDFYQYDSRCVTAEECIKLKKFESGKEMALVPYRGQCTKRCPKTYKMENNTCVPCPGGKCEKECTSGLIDSLERARFFHGCTIITGDDPLVISIKRDSKAHVMDELESSLSAVHKIQSSLMVHLTYGLTSLKFFKSLTEISGNMSGENKFALYVLENRDLEEIWSPNQTVFIRNGGVFFHFNPKLCVSTINKLLPMLASKPTYFDKRDVATDSNGNRGSCETGALNVTVKTLSSKFAVVMVSSKVEIGDPEKPSNATVIFKDSRAFIGFVFYHMIDPYKNATKSNDDPCDDTWKVSSPEKTGSAILGDLMPYTWYAYYVRTMAISSERTNAESKVEHFMTNPDQPSKVTDVVATATSDSKINVTWSYREAPNGKLSRFFIKAKLISRPSRNLNRDYCDEPLAKAMDNELPATTPAKKIPDILSGDCKCAEGSKKTIKKDFDDRTLHTGMEFENTLQNFIFVPKKRENKNGLTGNKDAAEGGALDSNAIPNGGAKNSSRPRRDIALEPELNNMYGSVLLRHVRSITDNPDVNLEKGDEKTYKDEERLSTNGKFFEVFGKELPPNQTSFVFENLRHFTRYSIFVVACREETANDQGPFCSEYESVFPTTKKKKNADNILDVQVPKFANNTKSSVRISWAPPADPNGEILTYEVAYKLQKPDQVEEKKCIPVEDFNQTVGYYLKLNEGKYSIRVRANSLAGYGNFTNERYTEVEAPLSYTKYFLWLSGIVGILLIVGLTGYVRHLRKEVPLNDFHINTEVNPFYASMQYIPDDWEVMRENIIQLAPLGQGSFGMVYNGILKSFSGNGVDRECAIKTVNENATDRERTNFLSEASVMKEFDTHHVVRLLGVCSRGQPALVVMELMKKGDLKSYLRAHRPEERDAAMMAYLHRIGVTGNVQPPTYGRIYQMAIEIADGMAYLAAKKFVHRDLAARNCMVAEDLTVKIGDFGMTRDIYETDYYRKGTKGLLPVRWMPPESLRDGVYSSASDVFSFGVVLWEMATLAAQPYQGYTNEQVLRLVIDGGVMERPENCPKVLDRLMEKCWRHRPSARPSFLDIIAYLEQQCPDSNFKDVSFYHSEMGLQHREKERKERSQLDAFAAVPLDHDQQDAGQQEDATTPLRTEQNSSLDQPAESPVALVDDHATHSPFSLQSGFIVSSTPDNQTAVPTAFQNLTRQSDDAAAYVQPDPVTLVEEKGYETYDPSPKCVELPTSRSGSTGGGGKLSGEQHLLPRKGRQPIIMSNSMPDDVIGGSSLQPSTASVGSSNASSQTGRYLKRVVADTLRNPANMINRHLFNHKRTGSNASHKSNASNAPSTSSNSNLTSHPVAMGNLGTIESGGSGSAGSFTGTPRFYTPSAAPSGGGVAISDNPNYRILDESVASEQATILTTSSPNPNYEIMHPSGSQISANPNYVPMKKSPVQMAGVTISQNPNYQPMQAPLNARQSSSEEDNEQEEGDEDDDEDVDDEHVEHIKMERMPLSRPRQKAVLRLEPPRSRSASKTRKSPTNPNAGVGTTGVGNMSNLLKESWLRPASTPRPPPPNGFIGREA